MSSLFASLSPFTAFWLTAVVASSYVLSVYISQLVAPPRSPLWRNEACVIKARLLCASASTLLSCFAVGFVVKRVLIVNGVDDEHNVLRVTLALLGIPKTIVPSLATLKQLAIVPLLFLGPLYAHFLAGTLPCMHHWSYKEDVTNVFYNWIGFRNFFVAPLTEEVTYRSCILALLYLGGFSRPAMIFAAPCWFGLAHIHHGYESYRGLGRTPAALRSAVLSTVFQFVYTTIFGWLCSYLFMSSGSLPVVTFAHIFCNVMGVPQLSYELSEHPNRRYSIISAYILGIALFVMTLAPWSRHDNGIYWIFTNAVDS